MRYTNEILRKPTLYRNDDVMNFFRKMATEKNGVIIAVSVCFIVFILIKI